MDLLYAAKLVKPHILHLITSKHVKWNEILEYSDYNPQLLVALIYSIGKIFPNVDSVPTTNMNGTEIIQKLFFKFSEYSIDDLALLKKTVFEGQQILESSMGMLDIITTEDSIIDLLTIIHECCFPNTDASFLLNNPSFKRFFPWQLTLQEISEVSVAKLVNDGGVFFLTRLKRKIRTSLSPVNYAFLSV